MTVPYSPAPQAILFLRLKFQSSYRVNFGMLEPLRPHRFFPVSPDPPLSNRAAGSPQPRDRVLFFGLVFSHAFFSPFSLYCLRFIFFSLFCRGEAESVDFGLVSPACPLRPEFFFYRASWAFRLAKVLRFPSFTTCSDVPPSGPLPGWVLS